jgi:membrane associated rhomboid family serine protease
MARKSKSERRRIREEQAAKREWDITVRFLSITIPVMLVGAILTLLLQPIRPGVQVIATTIWIGLAAHCWKMFYLGEFRMRNLYVNRAEMPRPFYLLATIRTIVLMSFATFVWITVFIVEPTWLKAV